jgi:FMN-dependent NADH-azoreductase
MERLKPGKEAFLFGATLPASMRDKARTGQTGDEDYLTPAAALEYHESYLEGVLAFIGLTDVTIVRAEGVAFGPEVTGPH